MAGHGDWSSLVVEGFARALYAVCLSLLAHGGLHSASVVSGVLARASILVRLATLIPVLT